MENPTSIKKQYILHVSVMAFLFLSLSSCVSKFGMISGNAQITNENFSIQGIGIGTSNTTSFLFFGTNANKQLAFEAKQNLYKAYPLKKGQALTNMTVDYTVSHWFLFKTTKAVLTAEIVDFNAKNDSNNYKIVTKDGFQLNEEVIFYYKDYDLEKLSKPYLKAVITNFGVNNFSILTADSSLKTNKNFDCQLNSLYKTKGEFVYKNNKYKIGDNIRIKIYDVTTGKNTTDHLLGKAIGIKQNKVLIYNKGKDYYEEYKVKPFHL